MGFLLFFSLLLIIPMITQYKVRHIYKKNSLAPASSELTGAEAARKILNENGLHHIDIKEINGFLSDYYDTYKKMVCLSSENFHGKNLSSIAVSSHEASHAIQDQQRYVFFRLRHRLVPLATIISSISWILLAISFFSNFFALLFTAVILMIASVLFYLVTLPVEFNASSRAKSFLLSLNMIQKKEERLVKNVLDIAILTYVSGAFFSVFDFFQLLFGLAKTKAK